ncbi:D-glycero-alpha-D-manno-heptose-1,7-bisphosphate 7-phosphatase [Streptomyces sp. NPDC003007]
MNRHDLTIEAPATDPVPSVGRVGAVLFDRDGTLVHDVPYNGDPAQVRPVGGAREALDLLRARGIRTGVVSNQSGVARGLITAQDVRRVNHRVDQLLGPLGVWAVCPHGPDDGCPCRKPAPGLILWAAGRLCLNPADVVVIGDIGADVEAARRAGAHGILVPNATTRPEEVAAAPHVAPDLLGAVRAVVAGGPEHDPADTGRGRAARQGTAHERPSDPGRPLAGPEQPAASTAGTHVGHRHARQSAEAAPSSPRRPR